jgi:putative ABC transport system ATP-binding protein
MGSEVAIAARGLGKEYVRDQFRITALQDVDLEIRAGEFVALMGPSGSGKSTLLHLIAAIDRPTSGEIRVFGEDLCRLNDGQLAAWRNNHVGFVFQNFNLIPVLTAIENVELPLKLTHLKRKERQEHAITALRLVGLEDRLHHYPRQLSGGQEQRVAIARAIVTDPTLILADEPTGNLDAASAQDVLTLLQRLNREFGNTIVMVTHDPQAARFATTIRYLEKGELRADGCIADPPTTSVQDGTPRGGDPGSIACTSREHGGISLP